MKIGIDGSALVKEIAGIGQWIVRVIENIMKIDKENEYYLFSYDQMQLPYELADNWQIVSYGGKDNKQINFLITLPRILKEYGIEVFVGTRHYLPPFNKKRITYVAVVHDLIPLYMPELFTKKHKLRFRFFTELCRRQADAVIAVSEATRHDVLKYMKLPQEKVRVIYEGANPRFNTERDEAGIRATMEKYHIDSDYVLCLSTVEPRKNMLRTIQAFEKCVLERKLPYKLVIVGGSGWCNGDIYEYVQTHDLKEHVIFTGYVSDEEVKHIYANATLFVYASLCEGFGLPVLEAMQSGIPVITSDLSSMPEVAGDACVLVDPYRTEQIEDAIARVLADEEKRKEMREKGLLQAQKFSWEKCGREVWEYIISQPLKQKKQKKQKK